MGPHNCCPAGCSTNHAPRLDGFSVGRRPGDVGLIVDVSTEDEDLLSRRAAEWAERTFVHHSEGSSYSVWSKDLLSEAIEHSLATLGPSDLPFHEDLSAGDPFAEEDDVGVVWRVTLGSAKSILIKQVRTERVPSVFHEAYIGERFRLGGVPAVEVLAVLRPKVPDTPPLLVLSDLRDHISLRSALTNVRSWPLALSVAVSRIERIGYLLGVYLRRLLDRGIIYHDFDLKNSLINQALEAQSLTFCDFERTRLEPGAVAWERAVDLLGEALARRFERMPTDAARVLEPAFTRGLFKRPAGVTTAAIAQTVLALGQTMDRPLVVAIDGLAGSGKTTLAIDLARHLDNAVVCEMDWFVRYSRDERLQRSFDLAHRTWYDFAELIEVLRTLQLRTTSSLEVKGAYSHLSGRHDLDVQRRIRPNSIVLLEGMYSAGGELTGLVDVRLVISTSEGAARNRFLERDGLRANVAPEISWARERAINSKPAQRHMIAVEARASLALDPLAPGQYRVTAGELWLLRSLDLQLETSGMHEDDIDACPFCASDDVPGRILTSGYFQAIYNRAPVVTGHVLVAPLEHVRSLLDMSSERRTEFFAFAVEMTELVVAKTGADAFDWALQDGIDAGQTVGHLHLHILPRRESDLDRPGAWYTSLFGPNADAPDSDQRPALDPEELRRAAAWIREPPP